MLFQLNLENLIVYFFSAFSFHPLLFLPFTAVVDSYSVIIVCF